MKKLVYGVGINDADYEISKAQVLNGQKVTWMCPFYRKWSNLLMRCYNQKYQITRPRYAGAYTVPEWHYFMTFRSWMETQDWQDKHLDKDILVLNNKVYGPDTCVFIDAKINSFITESTVTRGEWPIGVYYHKGTGKFAVQCRGIDQGKPKYLGLFDDPQKAHEVWLTEKLRQAKILAAEQTDPRVAKALVERYENYGKF